MESDDTVKAYVTKSDKRFIAWVNIEGVTVTDCAVEYKHLLFFHPE